MSNIGGDIAKSIFKGGCLIMIIVWMLLSILMWFLKGSNKW